MAILNGIIKKMTGSAGQQHQRMKWVNIIRMYSGIAPLLKNGFEKKMAQQSDYNMFVRLNSAASPVYLTKSEADGGGCIAAPYQITQGSLPSIVITGEGAEAKTDIALGSLTISASTTVAEFAKAVVDNNADFDYGDQISFYDVLQRVNAETQIPYCQFSASYVVLDKNSTVKLLDQVNNAGFASVGGVLAHGEDEGDGVFAWVHSRYDGGKTRVSTQFLINNNSLLDDYKSDDAYAAACKSYGGVSTVFLQPDGTGVVSNGTSGSGSTSGSQTPPGGSDSGSGSSGSQTPSGGSSGDEDTGYE